MLSQVNYRVPNMRFLRERLTVSTRPLGAGSLGGTTACPQERSHQRGACTLSLAVSRYCGYSLPPKKGNNLFVTIQVSRNASCVGEPGEAHNGGLGCAQILGAVRVPLGTYGGRKQSLAMFWPFPPLQNPGGR